MFYFYFSFLLQGGEVTYGREAKAIDGAEINRDSIERIKNQTWHRRSRYSQSKSDRDRQVLRRHSAVATTPAALTA